MILINNKKVEIGRFPDGTLLLKPGVVYPICSVDISWLYENNEEMVALMFLTNHVRRLGALTVNLFMPYIPNARQDRVKSQYDVFTLKYFAEFINNLHFDKVVVLDPHSSVSEALIDNIEVESPAIYVKQVVQEIKSGIGDEPLIAFYPDEGAMKRYSDMLDIPYAFGIKKRDWKTGEIQGLEVSGATDLINGSNIIIVDDICSRGGTFYFASKKLKELGAKNIYLYVSHCEKTIFDGEIFKSGLIKKVYTTDSIFQESAMECAKRNNVADKIEIMEC